MEVKIPLKNIPETFNISLNGVDYTITTKWNEEGVWMFDLSLTATSVRLLSSIPMVTGCDLLAPFTNLNIGGGLVMYTNGDSLVTPTYENLGTESNMYFVVV